MSHYGKGPRGKATLIHSLVVRSRGACQRCGRAGEDQTVRIPGVGTLVLPVGGLQAAHIVSRRFAATRTDETNAWALCAGCHRRLTERPDEHVHFANQTIGPDAYEALRQRAYSGQQGKPAFWQAEVERLTALLEEVAA